MRPGHRPDGSAGWIAAKVQARAGSQGPAASRRAGARAQSGFAEYGRPRINLHWQKVLFR